MINHKIKRMGKDDRFLFILSIVAHSNAYHLVFNVG